MRHCRRGHCAIDDAAYKVQAPLTGVAQVLEVAATSMPAVPDVVVNRETFE